MSLLLSEYLSSRAMRAKMDKPHFAKRAHSAQSDFLLPLEDLSIRSIQDHRQGRAGAHPAYLRHTSNGRVGVLFVFLLGPGGGASS